MKVDIICPLYEAENYVVSLNDSLLKQENVNINKIKYVLTKSKDNSEKILKENKLNYILIDKKEFSHSLTREKEVMKSKADIIVFISQDIVIENTDYLYNLVNSIIKGEADACYSRQLTKFDNIEKYTREANYPDKSIIKTKDDIEKLGLKTFFFSDASSAVNLKVFKKLNGYDGKKLPINEDMYFAYKLIINGYKIKYCADSICYHSHDFKLKELYDRYKLTGRFFKENSYIDNFGTNKSGGGLAKYILKRAIKDKNIKVLIRFIPDMAARYIGMNVGKR